jgi:O-succinylbenzoate synthase
LDEELISLSLSNAERILRQIKPDFLILKPTLLGGLGSCDNWIKLADKLEIGYWATSALESNIALNAIAQWIAAKKPSLPQGLGTGALYQNNITSPLHASKGYLQYLSEENWEMPL